MSGSRRRPSTSPKSTDAGPTRAPAPRRTGFRRNGRRDPANVQDLVRRRRTNGEANVQFACQPPNDAANDRPDLRPDLPASRCTRRRAAKRLREAVCIPNERTWASSRGRLTPIVTSPAPSLIHSLAPGNLPSSAPRPLSLLLRSASKTNRADTRDMPL